MTLSAAARAYLIGVCMVAVAGLLAWSFAAHEASNGGWFLAVELLLLGAVAVHFPLETTRRFKLTVAEPAFFALALLYSPPVAILLGALAQLVGEATLSPRSDPQTGKKARGWRAIWFNTALVMISIAAGAAVYRAVVPAPLTSGALETLGNLWAVPLAAAAMYLSNTGLVSGMVALHSRQPFVHAFLGRVRLDLPQAAALFLIGYACAVMALSVPWLLVVMAIPIAIVHLSLKRTLQLLEQTVSAVEALADLVDRRDRYTFEHSKRVASYAVQIARRLGMSAGQVETIRLAARVHDLGKIGVPDAVLLKEGRLTESEWEHMRRHPEYGYEILSRFPEYREGKELVLAHHERLDGRGYPRGIGGDRLPIEAQVIAAADTLDAMTSDRPYRRALVAGAAIEEFRRGSGQQWHPRVAAAVMDVLAGQNTSGRVAAPGHPQPAPLARPA